MTQKELNRAVARSTGETVREVVHRGFVPLTRIPYEREPRPGLRRLVPPDSAAGETVLDEEGLPTHRLGRTVDGDAVDAARNVAPFPEGGPPAARSRSSLPSKQAR